MQEEIPHSRDVLVARRVALSSDASVTVTSLEIRGHTVRVIHISFKYGDNYALVHAADVGSVVERKSNISRLFGRLRSPREKLLMNVPGRHNHTVGQESNVLTVFGLKTFLLNPRLRDITLRWYSTWLRDELLPQLSGPPPVALLRDALSVGFKKTIVSLLHHMPSPDPVYGVCAAKRQASAFRRMEKQILRFKRIKQKLNKDMIRCPAPEFELLNDVPKVMTSLTAIQLDTTVAVQQDNIVVPCETLSTELTITTHSDHNMGVCSLSNSLVSDALHFDNRDMISTPLLSLPEETNFMSGADFDDVAQSCATDANMTEEHPRDMLVFEPPVLHHALRVFSHDPISPLSVAEPSETARNVMHTIWNVERPADNWLHLLHEHLRCFSLVAQQCRMESQLRAFHQTLPSLVAT